MIGPDALPDTDRLVLKVSEMIKNGFLQQNAFDDVDMYCSSEKQIMILVMMMDFYKKGLSLVKNGCPLGKVISLPVCDEIVRIKYNVPNDQLGKVAEVMEHFNTQFGELESIYNQAGAAV